MKILIYTDGGCHPNPGLGSYAWRMEAWNGDKLVKFREHFNAHPYSTNQRMELSAVLSALQALTRPTEATIICDSEYVVKGVTEWLPNWKANHWRNANKKRVANRDLWRLLDALLTIDQPDIKFEWTRGHADNAGNNRVDELCTQTRKFMSEPAYRGGYVWIYDQTSNNFFIEKFSVWNSGKYDNVRSMGIVDMVTPETALELAKNKPN